MATLWLIITVSLLIISLWGHIKSLNWLWGRRPGQILVNSIRALRWLIWSQGAKWPTDSKSKGCKNFSSSNRWLKSGLRNKMKNRKKLRQTIAKSSACSGTRIIGSSSKSSVSHPNCPELECLSLEIAALISKWLARLKYSLRRKRTCDMRGNAEIHHNLLNKLLNSSSLKVDCTRND